MRHVIVVPLLALLLAGCSSNSTSSTAAGNLQPAVVQPSPGQAATVVGKLYLGGSVGGAAVTVQDLSGNALAQATTDGSGNFYVSNAGLPADFRVSAIPAGSSASFSAEVRGYAGGNLYAKITIPTTLVSMYLQGHPGLALSDAQTRVAAALSIPSQLDLAYGVEESPRCPFSHIAFWRQAGLNGGWAAYSATVLQQVDSGASNAYVLTIPQLQTPITGLESGLQTLAETARTTLAGYLVFSAQSTAFNPAAAGIDAIGSLLGGIARATDPTPVVSRQGIIKESLIGTLVTGVATGVAGNLITFSTKAVVGWGANQMGLNYGTSGQLREIQNTLNEVQSEITALNTTITDSSYTSAASSLYTNAISNITATSASLLNNIGSVLNSGGITNAPFTPSSGLGSLLGSQLSLGWTILLQDIQTAMFPGSFTPGGSNMISLNEQIVLSGLGIDQPAASQMFPWRNNNLIDSTLETFSVYAGFQSECLNLLFEQVHDYQINPNPVPAINSNLPTLADATVSLKTQRQMQPLYLPSDQVIVDLECGVMWYAEMQNAATYSTASSWASSLQVQGTLPDGSPITYNDWRLPTYGEMLSLQLRGTENPNSVTTSGIPVNSKGSYPNFGQATAGLPSLGFTNVGPALNSSENGNGSNGDLWFLQYSLDEPDSNKISSSTNNEFRLNHQDSSDNTNHEGSSSDNNAFLVCRTIGTQPLLCPYNSITQPGLNSNGSSATITPSIGTPVPSTVPSAVQGSALQPGEYAALGLAQSVAAPSFTPAAANTTQVTIGASPLPSPLASPFTISPVAIPANSQQVATNVSFNVNLGGAATMGANGKTTSFSLNPTYYSNGVVSTLGSNNLPNMLSSIVAFISSNDSQVRVLNLSGLDGLAIPYATGPTTVTAQMLGTTANSTLANSSTLTVTNITPHTLTSLQITPRNQIYGTTTNTPSSGPGANYPYFCTGFYADQTVASLAGNVTWSISSNNVGAILTAVNGGETLQINAPAGGNVTTVNITASLQGFNDTVQAQIVPAAP